MLALSIFAVLVFLFLWKIYNHLDRNIRRTYLGFLIIGTVLGTILIILYTAENHVLLGQPDMEGDAQYYFYSAKDYLRTGETTNYYPLYVRFVSLFMPYGSDINIRFAHLLLLLIIYGLSSLMLNGFAISRRGFLYFSVFTMINGAFYLVVVVIIRDILILLGFVLMALSASRLFLLYEKSKMDLRNFFLNTVPLIFGIYLILELQFVGIYVISASIFLFLVFMMFFYKTGLASKIKIIILFSILLLVAFIYLSENLFRVYRFVFIEGARLQSQFQLTGGRGIETNPIAAFLRFVMGPGVVRPLFPEEYFLVYTKIFALLNFWGAFMWFVNLILSFPLIMKRPFYSFKKPVVILFLVFAGLYAAAYAVSAGGSAGIRKRVVFYFFYTLSIAIVYYTPYVSTRVRNLRIFNVRTPIPYILGVVFVIFALSFATIYGLE